jgi:hypothetical protein
MPSEKVALDAIGRQLVELFLHTNTCGNFFCNLGKEEGAKH